MKLVSWQDRLAARLNAQLRARISPKEMFVEHDPQLCPVGQTLTAVVVSEFTPTIDLGAPEPPLVQLALGLREAATMYVDLANRVDLLRRKGGEL
jgi:hypothetical protein